MSSIITFRGRQFADLDVAAGNVPGLTYNNKFGRNTACAAGDAIWANSNAYATPATAELCDVASTDNTADLPAGTGALTVFITGINGSYDIVSETVTLNGTTNVGTSNAYFAIHRAYVTTAGTGGTAVGTITITSRAAGTPVIGQITIGYNQTQNANYMVPRNYTAYLNLINVNGQNTTASATLDLGLFKKTFGGVYRIQNDWLLTGSGQNWFATTFLVSLKFEAKSIALFKVNAVTGGGTWDVRIDYDIFLVAD